MYITIIIIAVIGLMSLLIIIGLILEKDHEPESINNTYYKKLFFLRKSELKFLKSIDIIENEYAIIPKLSLRKIIKTDNKKYKKELKKMTVDYAIFDKDYYQVLLLIELKYQSENINNQAKIDKLQEICNEAGIKFITFNVNSEQLNEKEIIDKIKEIIKENI